MKHHAFTLWKVLVAVGAFAIFAAMFQPLVNRSPDRGRRSACQNNLKQIGLAFAQYANDYDDKFPLVSRPEGWVGSVQTYLRKPQLFQCPDEEQRGSDNLTDYWFNGRLAGLELKKLAYPGATLLSGDGEPSDDPNVSLQMLPPLWASKEDSPAQRHLDGAEYLFADGHVKSLKPSAITLDKPDKSKPTFLVR